MSPENQKGSGPVEDVEVGASETNQVLTGTSREFLLHLPKYDLEDCGSACSEERARLLPESHEAYPQASTLARRHTIHPLESGNEDYRKAVSLFLSGRTNEALVVLSKERLWQQSTEIEKLREEVVRNWMLRGELLAAKLDFDGAAHAYGEVVRFAPDSYDAWFTYSFFHEERLHFKIAREGYEKALTLARARGKDEDVGIILNHLGNLHYAEKRMAEARQAYEEALKIRRELAVNNTEEYLPDVAKTLSSLGNLYRDENRLDEAREVYEETLRIYRVFAERSPAVYEHYVARVQDHLADIP